MSENIKKISFIFLFTIALMFLINTVSATTQNYDVVNLDATTYNYSPTPINPGENFDIWIQLTNNSNVEAKNIEYILETEYPFSVLEPSTTVGTITSIAPFQTKIIKYTLKTEYNVPSGTYEIELKYKRQGLEIYTIQKYNIDIASQKAIVDLIDTTIEPVKIGSSSTIDLTIKNLSGRDAKDIFVTLGDSVDEQIKVLDIKTKYIESLNANQTNEVSFSIIVDKYADKKTYSLPINISYKDSDGEYAIQRHIGFEVIDNPELLLTIQKVGTNYNLKPNSKESISLEIYNVGNVDAEAVYIELTSDAIERETRYFIGTIEKDNYDNIELKFDTKNVTGKQTLYINVVYKNSNLNEKIITEVIEVNFEKTSNGASGIMIVISTIISIIGIIIGLSLLFIILKWLFRILVRPAYRDFIKLFKR